MKLKLKPTGKQPTVTAKNQMNIKTNQLKLLLPLLME
jgi:hypothetical protein